MKLSRIASLAGAGTLLLVLGVAALFLTHERTEVHSVLQREAVLRAVAMAAHADQVLASADLTIEGVVRYVKAAPVLDHQAFAERLGGASGQSTLATRLDVTGSIYDIYAVDAHGWVIGAGRANPLHGVNVKDRPTFRFHQEGLDSQKTLVSVPFPQELAATPAFLLSRSVKTPQGELVGIIMVAISVSYFEAFYRSLLPDQARAQTGQPSRSALGLIRGDGIVLARSPGPGAQVGMKVAPLGPYDELSRLSSPGWRTLRPDEVAPFTPWSDGPGNLLFATQRLSNFPVHVVVDFDPALLAAIWREQLAYVGSLTAVSVLLLAAAYAWLARTLNAREGELEQIRRLRDEADQANRAKSEFLSTISHEIRTPLNGIVGTAELLARAPLADDHKAYAQTLWRSAQGLLGVIGDVLDFARIEAGRITMAEQHFDAAQLLAEVVDLFATNAGNKGLRLAARADPPRLRVVGDAAHMRQVLVNFTSNAVKFTAQGAVTLQMRALDYPSPGQVLVRYAVSDTGIGIDPAARSLLFEPFSQGDPSISRRFGGSGLGLAICARLIQALGGRIDFESRPGQGSTFWFDVPLKLADAHAQDDMPYDDAGTAAVTQASPREKAAPLQILVVEDDPTNCLVIEGQLASLGYSCRIAHDGIDALAERERVRPDLVLMDCNLPRMSGYEATLRWRELEAHEEGVGRVPIIALTANTMAENLEHCRAVGMNDFVPKPCSISALQAVIARWSRKAGGNGDSG